MSVCTYVVFAVLCGAASYIAVPAVQRLAIPEASPTLPLAASLGVTFSYNVTVGIPVYILIATLFTQVAPVATVVTPEQSVSDNSHIACFIVVQLNVGRKTPRIRNQ